MRGMLAGFIVIWAVTLVGYPLGRYGVLGPGGTNVLARPAFYVATPALLVNTPAKAELATEPTELADT